MLLAPEDVSTSRGWLLCSALSPLWTGTSAVHRPTTARPVPGPWLSRVLVMDAHDHIRSSAAPGFLPATGEAHPAQRAALQALLRVLATPETVQVTIRLLIDVADVVSDLVDTHPPMPPLNYPAHGAEDDDHACRLVEEAIAGLIQAVEASNDVAECLRAAIAARQLTAAITRSQP